MLLLLGLFTRPAAIVADPAHGGVRHRHLAGLGAWPDHRLRLLRRRGADRRDETKYPQEIARDTVFALAGAWLWWRPRTLASLDRYLFGH